MLLSTKKKKILLLNPPSSRPVLRDYYCSTFPKAGYYWHPIDLLALGASLRNKADVAIVDAVTRRWHWKKLYQWIDQYAPDTIFALVSSLTRDTDLNFLKRLASDRCRLIIGGEVALDPGFDFQAYPFIEGLLLDFTCAEATAFLIDQSQGGRLRTKEHIPIGPVRQGNYSVGIMPHEQMISNKYRLPLWGGDFFSLLTDFGCPFDCLFCNSGKNSLGFKLRNLDEVSEELRLLNRLKARKLYIRDMTFGANKKHAESVLELLARYQFRLRGYLRADQVTPDFARQLKETGFEMVQIGVESPQQSVRKKLRKEYSDTILADAFSVLRSMGVQVGAHFLIGLEGPHNSDSARACMESARDLKAAYCSINIYHPRLGTGSLPTVSGIHKTALSLSANYYMKRYNGLRYMKFILNK